jgi:hypothetical protein
MQFDNPPKPEKSFFILFLEKFRNFIFQLNSFTKKNFLSSNLDVLFFGQSKNNQLVLNKIIDNLESVEYKTIYNENDFPLSKSIIYSLPYIFNLFFVFFNCGKLKRELIRKNPLAYLFAYGKYIVAYKLLKLYSPKLLVMANDHSPINRCLLFAAKELNIKTAYLQHASVSEKFPPLEFDISFLDGLESFQKYGMSSKKKSRVILSGSPRYDEYFSKTHSDLKSIGISVNQFDDFNEVKKLCLFLKNKMTEHNLFIRPHPNMINWHRAWFEFNNINYSDSSKIKSIDFLKQINIQIANVSAIHLDAAMLGVKSIMFKLSQKHIDDQYDYVKNSLIKMAQNYDELEKMILTNNKTDYEDKISYYQANYNSLYKNKSALFIARYIENHIKNKTNNKIPLKYYEF